MQKSVYSISHGIKFCSLSLQVIDHIYCVAVQTTENTWAVYDMMCLNPEPVCSWLHQPSVCVFERPCKCACVYLFVKRVEPPDYTTCASLCQQLYVCTVLVFFGSFSVVS